MKKVLKNPEEEIKDIVFQFLSPKEYKLFIFAFVNKVYRKALKFPREIDDLLKTLI